MKKRRRSGILLHPTSLPGPGGIGSFGSGAFAFVDFLHRGGQSLWQVLPLGPTGCGNSPYSSYSAFAGNPLLIDLEQVAREGDIQEETPDPLLPDDWVDYHLVETYRLGRLREAAETFLSQETDERKREFWLFCDSTAWLHDYALFMALKEHFRGMSWSQWPEPLVSRDPRALEEYSDLLGLAIGRHKYIQWQFFRQWQKLKNSANAKGISIVGDMPIFVAYDSADVWANRPLFHLDAKGRPVVVAGVPPDYFSKTGQLWGNPLYDWERLADTGYSWWIDRMRNDLNLYDIVRIDHFRGFDACWQVPAGEKSAVNGQWVKAPGEGLFLALEAKFGNLPIIAEDLGVITPEVEWLRDRFGFPGMKILQFAFGADPDNPYLPHNHVERCVVYTGTHDNDTTAGWYASLPLRHKKHVLTYVGSDGRDVVGDLVRTALMSVAEMAIFPLQDLLRLDSTGRMNIPGKGTGNWSWRFTAEALDDAIAERLREETELFGRLPAA